MSETTIAWTERSRSLASSGYMLIRVGKEHPLADVRGYAYEHRLVASKTLGRWLLPSEQVHHRNERKADNWPENLEVVASVAEHRMHHRKGNRGLRLPGEPNPETACACGCGERFLNYDESRRPRRFVSGHNPMSSPARDAIRAALRSGALSRADLAARVGTPVRALAVTLSRLKKSGVVVRRSQGVYALAEPAHG